MTAADGRVGTGVAGFDEVLDGGLLPGRSYMVSGAAGTGKTVLALHFLVAGLEAGDRSLFVSFEEPEGSIRENGRRLGFELEALSVVDLSPDAEFFQADREYDVFGAGAVEGGGVVERIRAAIEEHDPDRVVLDAFTTFRRLARDDYEFRATAASLIRYLTERGTTVVFTGARGTAAEDLEFVSDGHVRLGHAEKGRTLEVTKFRGSGYRSGAHTMRITADGARVAPKLVPGEHAAAFDADRVGSGVGALDALLSGGITRGTVTVISGPSGVGKSTLGSQFMRAVAGGDGRAAIYLLEEKADTFRHRSRAIGHPVDELEAAGSLAVEEVEPLAVSADEFAAAVRGEVEDRGTGAVMIDGISGYRLAIRGAGGDLQTELHGLVRYLRNMGVTVVLTDETPLATREVAVTQSDVSYLADNVILLRYYEAGGGLNKAIGVLKMRASDFDRGLHEFAITGEGIAVGDRLDRFQGVLTGIPTEDD